MSLILDGTNGLSDVDGSAGTPAIRGSDTNTGIFFDADIIGFSEGGTECARFNADAQFVAAAGTASLPVITTTGDVNTGIFFPAADTIAFAEGGAEAMRIDSSGNLLVGQSSNTAGQVQITNNSTQLISNANGIYRVFTQSTSKASNTTSTCAITFGSQGNQHASHIVEVLFASAQDDANGGVGGRATFLCASLTSVGTVSEIQDIGTGTSFAATTSGSVLTITATTTSNRNVVAWTVKVTSTFSSAAPTSISIA